MALIRCPECNANVSERAVSCPQCGYPITAGTAQSPPTASEPKKIWDSDSKARMEASPKQKGLWESAMVVGLRWVLFLPLGWLAATLLISVGPEAEFLYWWIVFKFHAADSSLGKAAMLVQFILMLSAYFFSLTLGPAWAGMFAAKIAPKRRVALLVAVPYTIGEGFILNRGWHEMGWISISFLIASWAVFVFFLFCFSQAPDDPSHSSAKPA